MCRRVWVGVLSSVLAASALGRAELTATVNADRVNLRGRPSLSSEVVTQLRRGESLVVLESIKLDRPKSGEPSGWHRIRLPENTPVWVHTGFLDPTNKTVTTRRLNVRAGPGENYSVLGQLARGDAVREIRVLDDWMEIEPPPGAFAYVAASYVTLQATAAAQPPPGTPKAPPPSTALAPPGGVSPPVAAPPRAATETNPPPASVAASPPKPAVPAPPPTTPDAAPTAPAVAQSPAPTPPPPPQPAVRTPPVPPPSTNVTAQAVPSGEGPPADEARKAQGTRRLSSGSAPSASKSGAQPPPRRTKTRGPETNAAPARLPSPAAVTASPPSGSGAASAAASVPAPPPPRRVIRREGVVAETVSIQAPTNYKLKSSDTRRDLNFLLPGSREMRLAPFKGQRVVVTGEEQIEPRWPALPMIEVRTIELAP